MLLLLLLLLRVLLRRRMCGRAHRVIKLVLDGIAVVATSQ